MENQSNTEKNNDSEIDRYQRLIDISIELASSLDLNDLLNSIVDAAIDLTNAQSSAILLFEESKQQLIFQTSTESERPILQGIKVPVEGSIAGWIATHRKPVIIHDPQEDPRFYSIIQQQSNIKTHSLVGVPMIAKQEVIGVLEVINKSEGQFTQEDQEILMTLGTQAAIAIMNARLFIQSDLISEMVHELRTPLASLNAATHLLLRKDIPEGHRTHLLRIIQSETSRLSDLATSFLDLSRLESGQTRFRPRPIDLPALLGECVEILNGQLDEKQIQLTNRVPYSMEAVSGDKDKLKQVFINLMSNAIKYNTQGGWITLEAQETEKEVLISISDSGPGIPEESISRLFDKFYRAPGTENMAQGTGLGLSIVKKIISYHGGRVDVRSKVGKGTTFSVVLPAKGLDPKQEYS